jgi:hypothetical protein
MMKMKMKVMKKDRIIMPLRLISNLYCACTYPDIRVPAYANILGFDHGLILAITSRLVKRPESSSCSAQSPGFMRCGLTVLHTANICFVGGALDQCRCQPLNECMVLHGPVGCSSYATSPELGFHNWLCLFDGQMSSELS